MGQYFYFILEMLRHGKTLSRINKLSSFESFSMGQYFYFILEMLCHGKTRSRKNKFGLLTISAVQTLSAGPLLIFFSLNSISFFLFFHSTESHGKTRCVFTPPSNWCKIKIMLCKSRLCVKNEMKLIFCI